MQSARLYKYKCHGLHNKASQSESYSDTSHNGCSSVHLFKATRVEPGVSRRDQTKSLRVEYLSGCTTAVPVECPPDTPRVKKIWSAFASRLAQPFAPPRWVVHVEEAHIILLHTCIHTGPPPPSELRTCKWTFLAMDRPEALAPHGAASHFHSKIL